MLFEKHLEESKKISETNKLINNLKEKEIFCIMIRTFVSFFMIYITAILFTKEASTLFKLYPVIIIFCSFISIRRLSLSHLIGYPILNFFIVLGLFLIYELLEFFSILLLGLYVHIFENPEFIQTIIENDFIQNLNGGLFFLVYVSILFVLSLIIWAVVFFENGGFRNKNTYSFIVSTLKAKEKEIKKLEINCKEFKELILNNSKEKELAIKHILNKKNKGLSLDTGEKTLMNAIVKNTDEKEILLLKECLEKIGNKKENLFIKNI